MATVTIAIAVALGVALALRELALRRRFAALEREIETLRAQSKEAEQLATMGQLVSSLAQELKSPLQGVLGNTELMLAASGERDAEELRNIQENATRAAGLVRNLLAFTETTSLVRRWQDMNAIVQRAAALSRRELAVLGVGVTVSAGERVPLVYVDGRQLEKVISTLLSPRSVPRQAATIAIRTFRRGQETSESRQPHQDDCLVVDIRDESVADMADESTWAADLAACRQIVEAHGGSLAIDRSPGGASRFQIELPLTASALPTLTGSDHHG